MKKRIPNTKYQIPNTKSGFTLIELLVAIFIFSLIAVAIVSVFVSTATSYGKAKAIKTVKENAEFAMASIAKDVRMGRIVNPSAGYSDGSLDKYLMVSRNKGGKICYYLDRTAGSSYLGVITGVTDGATACPDPTSSTYNKMVNLSGTGMEFSSNAGFYSCPTDISTTESSCLATLPEKGRGWVEINLNIDMVPGKEMEADQVNIQTIVSSRDYGWQEVN
ncbi:MAG: prepilin-type N-terminal cleavage/methylation domain-containing protein [Patescibacteria group bacterium]|nr:prepilin-type N-terminal cleavage/methylation domain-containing protein [Patescibacteria group bacterium]